jgi:hypothetical protein
MVQHKYVRIRPSLPGVYILTSTGEKSGLLQAGTLMSFDIIYPRINMAWIILRLQV